MKSLTKTLFSTSPSCCPSADVGDLLLRLAAGLYLAAHGYQKFGFWDMFVSGVASAGFPAPSFFAACALAAELGGGILLVLGFLTRPAGFLIAFTMAVTAFKVHAADPLLPSGPGPSKEPAVVYLAIALMYMLRGAGRCSIDYLIERATTRDEPRV